MSIEIVVSADEVRYITDKIRTKILRSDIEDYDNVLENLSKLEEIARVQDETIAKLSK